MRETELDIQALRKASLKFGDTAWELQSFASFLDEEPLYLRRDDFGYTGDGAGKDLPATYDRIRQEIRDYLTDGGRSIDELASAVKLVATRTEIAEAENQAEIRNAVPGEYW